MSFKKRATKSIALALVGITVVIPMLNSVSALENNKNSVDNLNVIKNTKLYSINSYKSNDENITNSNQLKKTNDKLSLLNFNISKSGWITGDLYLENENVKFSIEGELLKDNESKDKFYGSLKTNNSNYEITNFSIMNSNEAEYNVPILNIYIKNLKEDRIEFYTLKLNQKNFNDISNLSYKIEDASIEDKYWFVKENEPEASMETSEDYTRAAVIRSVNFYPTLKWSYTDLGKTYNIESKYSINSRMVQSGDEVTGEFRIMSHQLKENGKVIKSIGQKLTRINGKWGSQAKIEYVTAVSTNGSYNVKQSPVYFNVNTSKPIGANISIGLRPNYSKAPVSSYPLRVRGYQASFEGKKGSYFEMSQKNNYLNSVIKVNGSDGGSNSYVGKNVTYQTSFTFKQGVYSKSFKTSIHAPLRTKTN